MRSYMNLAVLALAASTVSPALTAPIHYRVPRVDSDTSVDVFRRADFLRPKPATDGSSSRTSTSSPRPSTEGSSLLPNPTPNSTPATSEHGLEPLNVAQEHGPEPLNVPQEHGLEPLNVPQEPGQPEPGPAPAGDETAPGSSRLSADGSNHLTDPGSPPSAATPQHGLESPEPEPTPALLSAGATSQQGLEPPAPAHTPSSFWRPSWNCCH